MRPAFAQSAMPTIRVRIGQLRLCWHAGIVSSWKWVSFKPNGFSTMCLYTAAVFIRENRMTRKQGSLKVIASEDAHQARFIDPYDIGGFATRLICEKDFIRHNKAKYCCKRAKRYNV